MRRSQSATVFCRSPAPAPLCPSPLRIRASPHGVGAARVLFCHAMHAGDASYGVVSSKDGQGLSFPPKKRPSTADASPLQLLPPFPPRGASFPLPLGAQQLRQAATVQVPTAPCQSSVDWVREQVSSVSQVEAASHALIVSFNSQTAGSFHSFLCGRLALSVSPAPLSLCLVIALTCYARPTGGTTHTRCWTGARDSQQQLASLSASHTH